MITLNLNSKLNKIIYPYFHERDLPVFLNKEVTEQLNNHLFDDTVVSFNPNSQVLQKCRFVLIDESDDSEKVYRNIHICLSEAFSKMTSDYCLVIDALLANSKVEFNRLLKIIGEIYTVSNYKFYASYKKCTPKNKLELLLENSDENMAALEAGILVGKAINHARVLGDMPSNYLTPSIFVQSIEELIGKLNSPLVTTEIFDKTKLQKIKAGALLGVNQGSTEGAYMVVLKYQGGGEQPFTALVGKGLTFDSGGYNLKVTGGLGMKFDMCGAANVLGAFELIVSQKLPVNVYAVLPITENLLGATSYHNDDVLVSLSGMTIEVTNTDAEGRLILCDAINYAVRLGAERIIDVATLTGAIGTALGNNYTGAFTNNQVFYEQLKKASEKAYEPLWQMPVGEEYAKHLKKSKVADLVNSAKEGGGASIAASFLLQFIPNEVAWIHLDIASTASTSSNEATGVMVKTLAYLFNLNN